MAFCSECGNLYDITNTSPEMAQHSEESETKQEDSTVRTSAKGGRKQSKDTKSKTIATQQVTTSKQIGGSTVAYFSCSTCGNTELIKPRTHIIGRQSDDIAKEYHSTNIRPEHITQVTVLTHTRDYICPNKSCTTHAHPETRDAIMNRVGNTFKMQYTCTVCLTDWV
jgi:hypothetical protein